jgi:3-hydroxy-9,10-secoandrosta-1,3,5(10)-triene-9,17-dione monooxygenase reductase component
MTPAEPGSDPARFREAVSLLATGVTVVTTTTAGRPAGMTASAVCSLSLDPVALLVCISAHLPTHKALEESGSFAVNVLGEGQEGLARRFATPDVDRFAGVALRDDRPLPVLADAIATFECRVAERFPGGDHSIFIGHVEACEHRSSARPLLYFSRSFGSLESVEGHLMRSWADFGAAG